MSTGVFSTTKHKLMTKVKFELAHLAVLSEMTRMFL